MQGANREQLTKMDRLMPEKFGIDVSIMMEHAGLDVAQMAANLLGKEGRVAVLVGHGNKGGDGLCASRHLLNMNYKVDIFSASARDKFGKEALRQLIILENMGMELKYAENKKVDFSNYDLIIDALLGLNLNGNPRGSFADLIEKANMSNKKILAIDLPSGLDADTGIPGKPCIRANYTLTLGYPKIGLLKEAAKPYVGELYLGYLGVPGKLYELLGLTKIIFYKSNVIKVKNE